MKIPASIVLILWLGAVCAASPATSSKPSATTTDIQQILSWLPADTETLTVARGPFLFPSMKQTSEARNHDVTREELLQEFRSLPLALFGFKDGVLTKRLKSRRVALAVEGSRHFRSPGGLGGMPFEGCAVVVFDDDVSDVGAALLKESRNGSLKDAELEGKRVAVFQEKLEEDVWTTLVVFPAKNVVLVATNGDYLREVLTRLQGNNGKRAMPEDLPEWKYVDPTAPVWGIRHYDRSQSSGDPSSPYWGRQLASFPDEQAVGLTFILHSTNGKSATITYLSGDTDIIRKFSRGPWSTEWRPATRNWHVRYRGITPGVVEASFDLAHSEAADLFLFQLMGMLGHAVFI